MSVMYITLGYSNGKAKSNVRNTHNSSLITHNSNIAAFIHLIASYPIFTR